MLTRILIMPAHLICAIAIRQPTFIIASVLDVVCHSALRFERTTKTSATNRSFRTRRCCVPANISQSRINRLQFRQLARGHCRLKSAVPMCSFLAGNSPVAIVIKSIALQQLLRTFLGHIWLSISLMSRRDMSKTSENVPTPAWKFLVEVGA